MVPKLTGKLQMDWSAGYVSIVYRQYDMFISAFISIYIYIC